MLSVRRLAPVQCAEIDFAESGVEDLTRRVDLGPDARVPAHHGVAREMLAENLLVLDAVLDRHEGAVPSEASFQLLRGGLGVVGLHGEEDEIVGRKIGGALGRLYPEFQIAPSTVYFESVLLECPELLPPRAEDKVLTGRFPPRPTRCAAGPRSHHS